MLAVGLLDALDFVLSVLRFGIVALLPFVDFELVPFAFTRVLRPCADVGRRGFELVVG